MTLFNEANVVNILETALFHSLAVESLGDAVIDLVDYSVRQVTRLTMDENPAMATEDCSRKNVLEELNDLSPRQPMPEMDAPWLQKELDAQAKIMRFQVRHGHRTLSKFY